MAVGPGFEFFAADPELFMKLFVIVDPPAVRFSLIVIARVSPEEFGAIFPLPKIFIASGGEVKNKGRGKGKLHHLILFFIIIMFD